MLKWEVGTSKEFIKQPWKNGRGITTQLACDTSAPYLWRLSSAELTESGPFSNFPLYQRWVCLLSGGPVLLNHSEGKKKELTQYLPYKFSGAMTTEVIITHPAIDFNLFLLDGKTKGSLYITFFSPLEEYQFPLSGQEHFIFCVQGHLKVTERHTDQSSLLLPFELLRVSRIGSTEYPNLKIVAGDHSAVALWIPIHHL